MDHPSYRKPLTLALVLTVLSGLVYWFEFKKKPEDEITQNLEKKVFPLREPSVRKIRIEKNGALIVALQCTNATGDCKTTSNTQWVIQEPLKTQAATSEVQSLLGTILTMGSHDEVNLSDESPESRQSLLKSYGLDAESRKRAERVEIETDDGKRIAAYIGEVLPTTSSHYILTEHEGKPDESRVFLAPKSQVAAFEHPLSHWRSKRIVTLPQADVREFTLKARGQTTVAKRAADGWEIEDRGEKLRADADEIDTFLSGAVFLNAKNFHQEKKDSPEGKKALAGLKQEIVLELQAEKAKQTLRLYSKTFKDLGRTATIAYATVDELDPIFEVETTALDRMTKKPVNFRMKKLIPINEQGSLNFVHLRASGKKPYELRIKRENGEWKRIGEGKAVVKIQVNELMDRLSSPLIKEFLRDQAVPANALRVSVGADEKDIRYRFAFWKSGPTLLGKSLDSPRKEVFLLDASATKVIPFEETVLTELRKEEPKAKAEAPQVHGHDDGHGH